MMKKSEEKKSLTLRKTGLRVLNEREQLLVAAGQGGEHGKVKAIEMEMFGGLTLRDCWPDGDPFYLEDY